MKVKLFFVLICFFAISSGTFAQTKEARKIDEFGHMWCGQLMSKADLIFQKLEEDTEAKIYFI